MSKKGLSADEKAAKLLGWFHTTQEFFSLKEIEKAGAKATGISGMIIKEVLQALIDDGLVTMEKVGTSNYYWSYPGGNAAKLRASQAALGAQIEEYKKTLEVVQKERTALVVERGGASQEEEIHRQGLLSVYYSKQSELQAIKAELATLAEGDPAVYQKRKEETEAMKESALRWTGDELSLPRREELLPFKRTIASKDTDSFGPFIDQIAGLIAYARDSMGVEPDSLRDLLGLPEDYEELKFPA